MNDIPEHDWKYLKSIQPELLEILCKQINEQASRIVSDSSLSHHDKFLRLFDHVMEMNGIVADCFDDWRRSKILYNLLALRRRQLLTAEHISRLSEETRDRIDLLDRL
jgi:hypothetical protein